MKSCTSLLAVGLSLLLLPASAQDQKLALAPVEATATLVKKIASQPTAAVSIANSVIQTANHQGVWRGYYFEPAQNGKRWDCGLIISQSKDGSYKAELNLPVDSLESSSIQMKGNYVKAVFYNPRTDFNVVIEGELDHSGRTFAVNWTRKIGQISMNLRKTSSLENTPPDSVPGALRAPQSPPVDLGEITRKLDVQLAARLRSDKQFLALEGQEFKALALSTNRDVADGRFDLKTTNSLLNLSKAGVTYVLVTTLEDFQDQTLDNREWLASYRQYAAKSNYRSKRGWDWSDRAVAYNPQAALESVFTQSGSAGMVQFAKETEKLQLVFMEVQCKLYDAKTGELRLSGIYPYVASRFYSAVADSNNHRDTGDLYLQAARSVADSIATWMADGLTPMMVLKREGKTVTINRGLSSRLKVGEVYGVYAQGEEMFDPVTKKSLGRDEITKGRVAITELNEKFTKATILAEDKGIKEGDVLRKISR